MVANVLLTVIWLCNLILIARILISYFPNIDTHNPLVRFIHDVTEPILRPIRQAIPPQSGIDFSPMVAFLALFVISRIVTAVF